MSSSENKPAGEDVSACLAQASAALAASLADPTGTPDLALQNLIRDVVRLYAAKADAGFRSPLPPRCAEVGADDVMILATDLLHALNVQVFELSMWQAMTGNCIAPGHRN
jgi:hypothetical protein